MHVDTFIKRWGESSRNEAAAAKPHFIDLCDFLEVPRPTDDPTGSVYAFEKQVAKANGRKGWADVWYRGHFGWEYKSKDGDLNAAHDQLLRYAGALENPPLLIASDMARIVVRTNFTNTVTEATEITLESLRDGSTRDRLRDCWIEPDRWKPGTTRQALTEQAAEDFAEIAERLRRRGHAPEAVAHFVNRLVFCLFANDVRLLPSGMLSELLTLTQKEPSGFADAASLLFRAMSEKGGRIGFRPVPWFNGGLFDDDAALPLLAEDIALLNRAATHDWSQVDPSIFGTLFERGLDPDKRSQLGAHYTDRAKIELLVQAVITQPLTAEWEAVRADIAAAMAQRVAVLKNIAPEPAAALVLAAADAITAKTKAARKDIYRAADRRDRKAAALLADADKAYRAFLKRLRGFRVLDPACGSGNFLYVSMLALKDLELRVNVDAEAMGLDPSLPSIGPENVLGIEVNSFAVELARVSVWIGHIQWARNHAYPVPADPVLRKLDTIECRDALLTPDGNEAKWPRADTLIGNPPFLGGKWMLDVLGQDYTRSLRHRYAGRIPASADLVTFWVEKARKMLIDGDAEHVGLVTTNMIRGESNRPVMSALTRDATIFNAWSDEPWTVDGADVRVSLICMATKPLKSHPVFLNGHPVTHINADLSAGAIDLTQAKRLIPNLGIAVRGIEKGGAFQIKGALARKWLALPPNPNGRPNSDVLQPLISGRDLTGRSRDLWLIDFGQMSEDEAALYEAVFSYLETKAKHKRQGNREKRTASRWWRHRRSGRDVRAAIANLDRYIGTVLVSKHRVFSWIPAGMIPDTRLVVIGRADDTTFGILSSRFHEIWTLASCQYHGVGNDPIYTHGTTFETFPFPCGTMPNTGRCRAESGIAEAATRLDALRRNWLNPSDLVVSVAEAADGYPVRQVPKDAEAAAALKARTLTNLYNQRPTWLINAHKALDVAVAAAYGWPADLPDDEVLMRLLALNSERSAGR